jgi:hypothetical protein
MTRGRQSQSVRQTDRHWATCRSAVWSRFRWRTFLRSTGLGKETWGILWRITKKEREKRECNKGLVCIFMARMVFLASIAQSSAQVNLDRLSCMCLMPRIYSPPDNNCVLYNNNLWHFDKMPPDKSIRSENNTYTRGCWSSCQVRHRSVPRSLAEPYSSA